VRLPCDLAKVVFNCDAAVGVCAGSIDNDYQTIYLGAVLIVVVVSTGAQHILRVSRISSNTERLQAFLRTIKKQK
jgi:hypothetical protein